MQIAAAELLRGYDLAGRGLHERWSAEEDRSLLAHDHDLVGHRREVRAAGRARPQHRGDLRDALGGHDRLVVEALAKSAHVGEQLVLKREVAAARVDQVDAGQPVLQRDLLRPGVLASRHREVRPALHRRVVADDHHLAALDAPDPGDDPGSGGLVVVHPVRGQRRQLEERRSAIEQPADAVAGKQLPAPRVLGGGLGTAAGEDSVELAIEVGGEVGVGPQVLLERLTRRIGLAAKHDAHAAAPSSSTSDWPWAT